MNTRIFAGAISAYIFNNLVTNVPSRKARSIFLKCWLGKFGERTGVQMGCRFLNGRKVFFGERNVINFGSFFDGRRFSIKTGNNVSIGPEASILTLSHDPRSATLADLGGDVVIGDHVWIGYRAIILPGVTIGDGAVIGAGAIVTKNVDPYTIMAGSPARKIGERASKLLYDRNSEQLADHQQECSKQDGRGFNYDLDYHPWLV